MATTDVTPSRSSQVSKQATARQQEQRAVQPAVDIVEDSSGITLWADLPGVSSADLDVQVHDANLYIKAEAKIQAAEELTLHHRELQVPRFARSFALSSDFDTAQIAASLKDGVLKLSIPRHEKAKPRRIEVQAG